MCNKSVFPHIFDYFFYFNFCVSSFLNYLCLNLRLTLDIFPYREDGVQAAIQSKKWMEAFFQAVDRIGMDRFSQAIKDADACRSSALVREILVNHMSS